MEYSSDDNKQYGVVCMGMATDCVWCAVCVSLRHNFIITKGNMPSKKPKIKYICIPRIMHQKQTIPLAHTDINRVYIVCCHDIPTHID